MNTPLRIMLSVMFFLSIFLAPWFVPVLLALILLAVSAGYEIVLGGVLLDLLYGIPTPAYALSPYLYTALFILLFIVGFYVKKRLLLYSER